MNQKELGRVRILGLVAEGHLTLEQAAVRLSLSSRQLRRLWARFQQDGAGALAHAARGRSAANQVKPETAARILALARGAYAGFNDTHFHEMLQEREGIALGRETLRRLLRNAGIAPKRRRRPRQHRRRRDPSICRGLMVQWDASMHRWLGPQGPKWALMAAVDDADGCCLEAFFTAAETSAAYLRLLGGILGSVGIPLSLYQDRHGALRRNDGHWSLDEQLAGQQNPTQVGAALADLGIQPIFARCPQGKGRIERFFGVAQDRLVAELAFRGIANLQQANTFLREVWRPEFNLRFGRLPQQPGSAYRTLKGVDLHKILAFRYTRVVAADNTLTLGDLVLQLPPGPRRRSWAQARVDVRQHLDGSWTVYYHDQILLKHPPTDLREPTRVRLKSRRTQHAKGAHQEILVYFADEHEPPTTPSLPSNSPTNR